MNNGHNHPGGAEPLFGPADAASGLRLPTSTLRLYSVKFSTLLSDHARPRDRSGRPGRRRYTADDLEVLARARDLVRSGRSFKEALVAMGGTPPEEQSADQNIVADSQTDSSTVADIRRSVPTDQAVLATRQLVESATEGWRALAAQKGEEIDRLQREIETLEWELSEMRRPWWQRLFSGN